MILHDEIPCYYTDDGMIAIETRFLGSGYFALILNLKNGLPYYIRNFDLATNYFDIAHDMADLIDTRNDRTLLAEDCYICKTGNWYSTMTCVQCGNPIIHGDETFPKFNEKVIPGLTPPDVVPLPDADKKVFVKVMGQGRRATSLEFHSKCGIRLPFGNEERKRRDIYARSFAKQAQRMDHRLEESFQNAVRRRLISYSTLDERIQNDSVYRIRLAMSMVNAQSNFAPAQIILGRYHRMAFELAIQNEEIDAENSGERKQLAREKTER